MVAAGLEGQSVPIVLDPVMVAKSGDALLQDDAVAALCSNLLTIADLLTPNWPEAGVLLNCPPAHNAVEMEKQGRALLEMGAKAVLMKGGHADGSECVDILVMKGAPSVRFEAPRIVTRNTHGTGCTLSASIAAGLSKGLTLSAAVGEAHSYLQGALAAADKLGVGSGHGPVHHFYRTWN